MSFKEFVEADLKNVFLNCDEFAEVHDLNGTKCSAIIEKLTIKERSERPAEDYEGTYGNFVAVYVKKSDLPEVPVYRQIFRLDGKLYSVESCNDDMGMLMIELAANDV